jgi:hypothetical protein
MERYQITLKGETPLLMHHDNLMWDGVMKKWALDPANKKGSVAGDDRSPAFRWIGYLYRTVDGKAAAIPSDNLMTVLREGGAKCPTGKGQQTFKAITQSGIIVDQSEWALLDPRTGKPYSIAGVDALIQEAEYEAHEAWAAARGFELFAKRAKVGQAKHVRVRPRFDQWATTGTVTVLEPRITKDTLQNIISFAGAYSGLCDWRPSSPKSPGSFGRFTATLQKL